MPLPSHLDSSAITYSRYGYLFQSAAPIAKAMQCDVLTFLSVVQKLDIDFLPVTWQPALDSIGRGATAEIRQASVNLQTSFAFKHIRWSRMAEDEAEIFQALIAEILVLGHPLIRKHHKIVTLEGISWDVINGGESILPVLVFKKAQHGSLLDFMEHDIGRRLHFRDRVYLCAEIAEAVVQMHAKSQYSIVTLQQKP